MSAKIRSIKRVGRLVYISKYQSTNATKQHIDVIVKLDIISKLFIY